MGRRRHRDARAARRVAAGARPRLVRCDCVDAGSFVRARALRDVLRELAKRNTRGADPDDALRAEFAAIAADARAALRLGARGDVRLESAADGRERRARRDPRARVRGAGVRRLEAAQVVPGPHCGWLFYDASRNASSTWCSMSICGNRTKTAAYRQRRRTDDEVRVVRRRPRVEAPSPTRQRRRRRGARARVATAFSPACSPA